jgi:NADH dehydrogenase
MKISRKRAIVSWAFQLLVAGILFQTLFFKFTGAAESRYIFGKLGLEPWGRISSGVVELVAVILLLVPGTVTLGAVLTMGVIGGAIVSHLTKLGILVPNADGSSDGGLLFVLAVTAFVGAAVVLVLRKEQIPLIGRRFRSCVRIAPAAAASPKKKVLILGGGFGGLYAALHLERTLARDGDVEITLVNRENFFLFTPMLHEVAASDLDLTDIVSPVRKLLKWTHFFQGDVERIDLPNKTVVVSHGFQPHTHELNYDYLVISLGCITNFFNLPGLAERALTMKSLGDAIHLRNRLIAHLEEADTECAKQFREPLLTFVVAGGGFAGVETIGGLNDFVREALPHYPRVPANLVRMVLVHSGDLILPELGEKLGRYAQRKLSDAKVEIHTNTKVAAVDDDGVTLSDGTFIRTNTVIWTAGTSPHPLLATLPCARERGRLVVNEYLELPEWPGVWALGDCAVVPDRRTGKPHPPTAQHALREGKVVAQNVEALVRGSGRRTPFTFATLGLLATIGRRTGVARVLRVNFSGFVAWWLWRMIYLMKLPRFEKKIRVGLEWSLDLFFPKDIVQYLTLSAATLSEPQRLAAEPMPSREACDQPAKRGETKRETCKVRGIAHVSLKSVVSADVLPKAHLSRPPSADNAATRESMARQ